MSILFDSRIASSVDDTYFFLAETIAVLNFNNINFWFHPNSEMPELQAFRFQRADYPAPSSHQNGSIQKSLSQAIEVIQAANDVWGTQRSSDEVEVILKREIALIQDLGITGVIVWGSKHPQSVTLQAAAALANVPSVVIERGLIPNSWTIFEKEQWEHSPSRHHENPVADVEEIKHYAQKMLTTPFEGKYSEPLGENYSPNDHGADKQFIFCSGFTKARGITDSVAHESVNKDWEYLVSIGEIAEIPVGWRGHPADLYRPSPRPEKDWSNRPIMDMLSATRILICHSTNVWAYGILAGVAVVPIEMESAREFSLNDEEFFSVFESGISTQAFNSWLIDLNKNLTAVLDYELRSTHFYYINVGPEVPGAFEFARQIMKMLNLPVELNAPNTTYASEYFRELNHVMNLEVRKLNSELLIELDRAKVQQLELEKVLFELDERTASLAAITDSSFWKLSRPLREFVRLIKG